MIILPSKPLPEVALCQFSPRGSFPQHLRVFLFPSCFWDNSIVFLVLRYILWKLYLYRCFYLQVYREIDFASCGSPSICALSSQPIQQKLRIWGATMVHTIKAYYFLVRIGRVTPHLNEKKSTYGSCKSRIESNQLPHCVTHFPKTSFQGVFFLFPYAGEYYPCNWNCVT